MIGFCVEKQNLIMLSLMFTMELLSCSHKKTKSTTCVNQRTNVHGVKKRKFNSERQIGMTKSITAGYKIKDQLHNQHMQKKRKQKDTDKPECLELTL